MCRRCRPHAAAERWHLSWLQVVQDTKGQVDQRNDELLSSFNVATFKSDEDDAAFWNRLIPQVHNLLQPANALSGLSLSLSTAAVCLVAEHLEPHALGCCAGVPAQDAPHNGLDCLCQQPRLTKAPKHLLTSSLDGSWDGAG